MKYANGFDIGHDKLRNFVIPKKSVKQTEKVLLKIQRLTRSKSPSKNKGIGYRPHYFDISVKKFNRYIDQFKSQ